jgi:DNA transformation protein and related proteins
MSVSNDYLAYLQDLFEWLPRVRIKRMFGGAGLYSDELFFAIADDNAVYLKADKQSEAFYRQRGAEQFSYEMKGKPSHMNFWLVPAEVLEDPELLHEWVDTALGSALRGKK